MTQWFNKQIWLLAANMESFFMLNGGQMAGPLQAIMANNYQTSSHILLTGKIKKKNNISGEKQ